MTTRLILASASPRRRELLSTAGFAFSVETSGVVEELAEQRSVADYAQILAAQKATTVAARHESNVAVLGADTVVALGKQCFGKPVDRQHALAILKQLAGRTHEVITAVCILSGGKRLEHTETTKVTFRPLTETEIECYLDRAAWQDKAGGYAIQAEAAWMVSRIEGSYTNVVGLPLSETIDLLRAVNVVP